GLLHLLIAALAANAAMAADDCKCVNPDQTIDPISAPMIFFQQPTIGGVSNGVPCAANCTFNAHAYGDKGLAITILANDLNNAKITVTDGPRTFLITKNTVQKDIDWKSTGDLLTFNFEGEVSPVATFMLVVQSTETRDPLPVIISTTAAAPTPPYDNLKYHNNPLLVADDIMIGIDLSSNDVENLKAFASDLISTLTITNATDCGAGTRLALHGLTNFDGFSPTYFPDWQYTLENALGNIKAMSQIGSGAFNIGPVSTFVESGFKKAGDEKLSASDCLNRGRIYLLLTTSQPAEYQPAKPAYGPIVNFIDRGVHPIIVTSLKEDKRPYYDQYGTKPTDTKGSNRWSYFNIDSGVTNFINNYLVDTIPDMSCQLSKDYKITLTKESINQREAISIPPYYDGMNSDQQNTDSMEEEAWGTSNTTVISNPPPFPSSKQRKPTI
ncbi:hypothetical protein PENTCL1PPCAC_26941, partial [Pristionchus entomophagus]